jgi:high affinity Mn2+ porin
MNFRNLFLLGTSLLPIIASAQTPDSLRNERFSVHGQTTVVTQYKPSFSVPYSGENSLLPERETRTSITSTLFLGARLWKGASVFLNPELAGGSGLSQVLGIAAATNGETFRVGDPSPQMYLARLFFHQVIPLQKGWRQTPGGTFHNVSDFNQVAEWVPTHYLAFTAGKISIADYFDDNSYSHDPRTQFLSWALMSNGGWDYPANTRGYTPSVVLEYVTPHHEIRYGFSLEPKVANGPDMNWEAGRSGAHTLEYTYRYQHKQYPGAVRVLGFYNYAPMGNYREAIALNPAAPDLEAVSGTTTSKYGFGINAEQALPHDFGVFARAAWNDGTNETWAFTEIDRSASIGAVKSGTAWHRAHDHVGLAYCVSGLSDPHRDYLAAGGTGFMLGDGTLRYSPEQLAELYYQAEVVPEHFYVTGTAQAILNPGYNADRSGPVGVFSVRAHMRF